MVETKFLQLYLYSYKISVIKYSHDFWTKIYFFVMKIYMQQNNADLEDLTQQNHKITVSQNEGKVLYHGNLKLHM